MSLISAALKRPVTTIATTIAFCLVGAVSLSRLPVPWSELAVLAGVTDTSAFRACTLRGDTQLRIVRDMSAAEELHAIATPTVLVNDLLYSGVPPDLMRIVRHVRRRAI